MAKYLWLLVAVVVTFGAQWANIALLNSRYDRLSIYLALALIGALAWGLRRSLRRGPRSPRRLRVCL